MNRDDWKVILRATLIAACMVLGAAALADEPKLPAGKTCADVRENVARYGRFVARTWARLNGYTKAEIREAEKCLK